MDNTDSDIAPKINKPNKAWRIDREKLLSFIPTSLQPLPASAHRRSPQNDMKRRSILIGLTVIVVAFLVWWHLPQVSFRMALFALPHVKPHGTESLCSLNTFTDNITSADVGELFAAACKRLDQIRGKYPRRTYDVGDPEGSGTISVVQYPDHCIWVGTYHGNDSESIWLNSDQGVFYCPFSVYFVRERGILTNDQIPKGWLRPLTPYE